MKAAGIAEYRGPVSPLDLAAPTLAAPHQLLIEVYAAGVGNWDDIVRTGAWDIGAVPPMALGVEASGVVRGVGREVSRFRAGDQVLTHSVPIQQGTWAELFVARQEHVAHKPSNMPWLEAALFPVPALTAHQVLGNALALQPGETVLIHGAGGVTGGVLVALASDMGVRVIATAGPQSMDRVRRYGASLTVDYHVADWPLQVRAAAGDRLPAVVNAVRGEATRLISIVADGGRLATITGDPPSPERGIRVSDCYVSPDGAALEQLAMRFAERGLSIPRAATFELPTAGAALAEVTSGKASGGIAITVRKVARGSGLSGLEEAG